MPDFHRRPDEPLRREPGIARSDRPLASARIARAAMFAVGGSLLFANLSGCAPAGAAKYLRTLHHVTPAGEAADRELAGAFGLEEPEQVDRAELASAEE